MLTVGTFPSKEQALQFSRARARGAGPTAAQTSCLPGDTNSEEWLQKSCRLGSVPKICHGVTLRPDTMTGAILLAQRHGVLVCTWVG